MTGYIIILHKCTKNHDYMLYCSWDMACDRCNCSFPFWTICPFHPLNSPKNENFKKMKRTPEDIIILHNCTKTHDHMLYCSWEMVRDRWNCYFSFWAIFCPFNEKMPGDIIILHMCTKNNDLMMHGSWYDARQMDGQTNKQMAGKSDM